MNARFLLLSALILVPLSFPLARPVDPIARAGDTMRSERHEKHDDAQARRDFSDDESASFRVRGYGLFGNRSLARIAEILRTGEEPAGHFTPPFLENVLILLHAQVERDGYYRAQYIVDLVNVDGSSHQLLWNGHDWLDLSPEYRARAVTVHVERGVRFFYEDIVFTGLRTIRDETASGFFVPGGYLFDLKRFRIFSPSGLDDGLTNLVEELRHRGFRDAEATVEEQVVNDATGAVSIRVAVAEGPRYRVVRWKEDWEAGTGPTEGVGLEDRPGDREPWSEAAERRRTREVLNRFYRAGYPDVVVRSHADLSYTEMGFVDVTAHLTIDPGPRVRVNEIQYVNQGKTKDSVLERRVDLVPGDLLDVIAVDEGRFRIARLGIYQRVDTELEGVDVSERTRSDGPEADEWRNVIYHLEEDKRIEASLLFGYGSYEALRIGAELERTNLWGRAHRDQLRLVQSFKSSSGRYRYAMPEIFAEDVEVQSETSWLRREELSFDRIEWGTELRITKEMSRRTHGSIAYRLERLRIVGLREGSEIIGSRSTRIGAIQVTWSRDTRDNPLYPTRGNHLRGELELGSQFLGADVTYQRLTVSGSKHWEWRDGLIIHGRLSHGIATTFGADIADLPINKRFFPGGAHSIRGFRQGGAAPRDELGQYIGAETYTLVQLELERALSPSLSGVIFTDHLYYARGVGKYPGEAYLLTVGLGLRYRTVVGPLRVEFGYNVNPRVADPRYRLQVSLGFPF